jgi:hypothetical protein
MPSIIDAIISLVPGSNPLFDFAVVERLDGKGPQFEGWSHAEPKPTPEQIAAEMARLASLPPPPPPAKPTLADVIAVLPPQQQLALQQRLAAKAATATK